MRCPHCDSRDYEPYKDPAVRADAILRRHRCRNCKGLFMSIQLPVTGKLAVLLAELVEE